MRERQTSSDVLMIRPSHFAANSQTASSNRFQGAAPRDAESIIRRAAVLEFDGLAAALRSAGVRIYSFDDIPLVSTPDAVFPNNWVSYHADGTVVLYPMLAENRRLERRPDITEQLIATFGFQRTRTIDMSTMEGNGFFLEGTGSLVLDRVNRIAYAAISPRTIPAALDRFARDLDYETVSFRATDEAGQPIYHTNVVMSVGTAFAAICLDSIVQDDRNVVLDSLRKSGREVIDISYEQMNSFAGNMLELSDVRGEPLVAMSSSALASLSVSQRNSIEHLAGPIVASPIPTIERIGGGSVRCMLAEIHLPRIASGAD